MAKKSPNNPTTDREKEGQNKLVLSYMALRNLLGVCGAVLPFVLIFTTKCDKDFYVEGSISEYYYTSNGDVFVAIMCIMGVFLITYKGYGGWEKFWTTLAAVCALLVAFNPTEYEFDLSTSSAHPIVDNIPKIGNFEWHLIFAAVFLISLGIISIKYFPKSDKESLRNSKGKLTQKGKRNIVYKVCGWTMLGSIAILAVYFLFRNNPAIRNFVGTFPIVFFFEAVALEAFALSWLTKGETFWPDGKHYIATGLKQAGDAVKALKKK